MITDPKESLCIGFLHSRCLSSPSFRASSAGVRWTATWRERELDPSILQLVENTLQNAPAERPTDTEFVQVFSATECCICIRAPTTAEFVWHFSAAERCICGDKMPSSAGIRCGAAGAHFTCGTCLSAHIVTEAKQPLGLRERRHGKVFCPVWGRGSSTVTWCAL